MTFDDQDWVREPLTFHNRRAPSPAWKWAAALAGGALLGALAMSAAFRYAPQLAAAEAAKPLAAQPALTPKEPPRTAADGAAPRAEPSVPDQGTEPAKAKPTRTPEAAGSAAPPAAAPLAAPLPNAARDGDARKERAWTKWYKRPPQCDDTSSSDLIVECANHFIRARRQFEAARAASQP